MRIDANGREQINNDITRLRQSCDEIELKYHAAKQEVDDNSILGNKYKNTAIIDELIGFLQDERADNIKEAINLYHEEQHRTRIEEYAKEQLRLTQEASKSAQEAARYAQEAASKAEAAIDRANEAYYGADEAFNKADDAYFEAHNHS